MNAPVIGAEAGYAGPDTWSMGLAWRYQKSDRHFTGTHEEPDRQAEGSEVINDVHMFELALTRTFTERASLTIGIPYFLMERSQALRDPSLPDNQFGNDPVVDRTTTQSRGIGDITLVPHWWAFNPETNQNRNLWLGVGLKVPTGNNSVEDTFQTRLDTPGTTTEPFEETNVVRTVDQSIQLGDGGFGAILDVQGFWRFAGNRAAAYVTGTYLSNPGNVSEVPTWRGGDSALSDSTGNPPPGSEAFMSIADQYLARLGATWFPTGSLGVSLGARWEGIPVHDVIGAEDGFRRPGYAISVEPGLSYSMGTHTLAFSMPIAAKRNRTQSVPDIEDGGHGDAAFADYVLVFSYFKRFGGSNEVLPAPTTTVQ